MPSPWLAVGLILAVFVLAMVLRRQSGGGTEPRRVSPEDPTTDTSEPDVLDPDAPTEEDGLPPPERVPVTAEGLALVQTGHQITLVPLVQSEEIPEWLRTGIEDSSVPYRVVNEFYGWPARGTQTGGTAAMTLGAGDFTAARLRREAAGWRVETLGRDGDFGFFPFETESGARLALDLLQHLEIVQVHLDNDLQPIPASTEDFEEARRRYEETEQALALENDPGEGLTPGDYSDRR